MGPFQEDAMPHRYLVKQVMTRCTVIDIKEHDSLAKAVLLLDDCDVSALPVIGVGNKYVGVISKSDIASVRVVHALKTTRDLDKLLVKDFMNKNLPVAVSEEQPLHDAVTLMHKRHIHRVFVMNEHRRLTGVLSTTNLVKLLFVDP